MTKKLSATALGAVALAALAACSSPAVHGTVTAKQYIPESTQWDLLPYYGSRCMVEIVIVYVNKQPEDETENVCSQYVLGYRETPINEPECWQLSVGKDTTCVSKDTYNKTKVGDKI